MFELNSLAMKYHLRDLEHQFTPKLGEYRAEPKFYPVRTLLVYAAVTVIFGAAYVV